MAAVPRRIALPQEMEQTLVAMRDHHPKPYLRERAAAVLKVARGGVALHVAQHGLLRPRDPDTVDDWLDRYEAHGFVGLYLAPGRGRKPAFSP